MNRGGYPPNVRYDSLNAPWNERAELCAYCEEELDGEVFTTSNDDRIDGDCMAVEIENLFSNDTEVCYVGNGTFRVCKKGED